MPMQVHQLYKMYHSGEGIDNGWLGMCGASVYGNSVYLNLNFAVNLKLF